MRYRGQEPNAKTYNGILSSYMNRDDLPMVLEIFQAMQDEEGITPDKATYSILMTAYANGGLLLEAEGLLSALEIR
eukprot:jgi/Bigna1/145050/aug1.94_g19758